LKFFKYWASSDRREIFANGKKHVVRCWGWSDASEAAARKNADHRLGVIEANADLIGYDRYPYGVGPIREMLIASDAGDAEDPAFVITRNSYGSLILNAARAMFVDIDVTISNSLMAKLRHYVSKWFSSAASSEKCAPAEMDHIELFCRRIGSSESDSRTAAEKGYIEKLTKMAGDSESFSARVYRTARGLRYIITHREFDPASDEVFEMFNALGGDPMYSKLCRCQRSFRARLTPKSWRCGVEKIKIYYPFESAAGESAFKNWLAKYESVSKNHATCKYLTSIGSGVVDKNLAGIIRLHDETSLAGSELPLA